MKIVISWSIATFSGGQSPCGEMAAWTIRRLRVWRPSEVNGRQVLLIRLCFLFIWWTWKEWGRLVLIIMMMVVLLTWSKDSIVTSLTQYSHGGNCNSRIMKFQISKSQTNKTDNIFCTWHSRRLMWAAPPLLSPSDPPRSRQSIGSQRKRCNRTMLKKVRVTWLQWEGSTCLFPGRTTHVKFRVISPVPQEAPAFSYSTSYTWYWCFTLNYLACQVNWGRWPRSKEGIDMSWWWLPARWHDDQGDARQE